MRVNKVKVILILCIMSFLFFGTPDYSIANSQKTLILVLDELDFEIAEKIITDSMSIGLMSIKTAELYRESSKESFFMTMAAGRRVKIKEGLYRGVKETNIDSIVVDGYYNITKDFNHRYPAFSREINLLGDTLRKNGIKTGFLGDGPSSLLIADKKGEIDKGINNIYYNDEWLIDKTNVLFKSVDVLVVSYNISKQQDRVSILKKYINEYNDLQILVFPDTIKGDIAYKWNMTLVPLIYRNDNSKVGILTSNTTRRDGIVTNLDIKADIEANYGISKDGTVGNRLSIVEDKDIINKNKNNLLEFLNLNIIKYVFHGYVILAQLYVLYNYVFRRKRDILKYKFIMTSIILSILISLIYGLFNFHRYLATYCVFIIITSLVISKTVTDRGISCVRTISIITNILILLGVFLNFDMIYNSFIGYNNIVAAGRFYGLNNEIMGVLIATAIIVFFELKELFPNHVPSGVALIYFIIVIIALSGGHGANVGGYITSIVLFLILIYITLFGQNKNKKNLFLLMAIGIIILGINLYFDINSINSSHAGGLIERIRIFGFSELIYIFTVKIKQLLIISILPPWSIILLSQIFFVRRFFKEERGFFKDINETGIESFEKYCIIFIASFVAFIINDTGAVAFTYINTYLIASLFNAYEVEI